MAGDAIREVDLARASQFVNGSVARARALRYLGVVTLLATTACGYRASYDQPAPHEIDTTLLLIGDAGEPDPRSIGAPLDSLFAHASHDPSRTVILYLGDNVYPDGIPEDGAAEWTDARRRVHAQVRAVPHGAKAIFVPGNHDWANSGAFGLYALRHQERMIEALAEGRDVRLLPSNGCPGPVSVESGRLRLVLVDTQWWLHSYIVEDGNSNCPTNARTSMSALREQIVPAHDGQLVIVAGHHPMITGGEHGGYCGITGPFKRIAGRSQDILSSKNREMRDSMRAAFAVQPPLIYAAGHEHNLQVLRGAPYADYLLVSGAGSASRVACVVRMRESEFVSQSRVGFMRLDILRGRGVLLRVYHFDRHGSGGEVYFRWLESR
ncbi:hypothetical protein BH23GEM9_BH23GEM9_09260 [soil metagenome]